MAFKKRIFLQGVGRRLRKFREHLNFSGPKMAATVGIQNAGYNKNEKGDNFLGLQTLYVLHKKFKLSMDWLLFNTGAMFAGDQTAQIEEERQRIETKEKELEAQLEQVKEWKESFAGFQDAAPEIGELLDTMAKDPQLRHEVLVHLYKYKKKGEVGSSE
jgi:transcriptional regulator with XRE-family HTH domain